MPYRSHAADVKARIVRGVDAGLIAAAQNVTQKIRARLDRGYTTGAFSHHARGVAGRVMYTEPGPGPNGGRVITIGTSKTAVPYELYWEMGHVNIFVGAGRGPRATLLGSRREGTYMRVEIWRPMLEQNAALLQSIVARNVARFVGA